MKQGSIASSRGIDPGVILALVSLGVVLFYLAVSARTFDLGFPLDDAWIHQTYARNLAEQGEWAFRPGESSAGSTAPLWTALLSIGFLIGLGPYVWTYLCGWVVLTLLAVCAEILGRALLPAYRARTSIPWVGLFMVFAWHLTWAAVSGMETLLHGLIILAVLGSLMTGSRRYLRLGLLAGLSIWVRPDGMTLLGPILFTALLSERTWHLRREAIWKTLIGFGSLVLPYVLFNLALSGNPMPNTFYAKQAEYAAFWLARPLGLRIADYLWPVLASPFVVLLPGAALWLAGRLRLRDAGALASLLWVGGYVAIYFLSLPAYQHGRYIIPVLPVLYLWGMLGLLEVLLSTRTPRRLVRVWPALTAALCLAFAWLGARQNAQDVRWVESEMVATAAWVKENLPADARLAVHDIGALGFYTPNPIIDLAGLITPEVVPFIRDEDRLARYLDEQDVAYLVTLPGFYPQLTARRERLFEAGLPGLAADPGGSVGVYRWK